MTRTTPSSGGVRVRAPELTLTSSTLRRVCATVAFTLTTLHATASSGQAQPPSAQESVIPPKLVHFVEAHYPPLAHAQGREGVVLLSITIDETGAVTEATSRSPAGYGFDEAAVSAARAFRFEPALRNGVPTAVRIQFRTVFELRETAVQPPAPPPDDEPPPAPLHSPPSPAQDDVLEFEATAEVEAQQTEPTRRTIPHTVMIKVPGTRGDALRAVEVLPGVAGVSNGNFVLRGAAHNESQVFFEGMPVPILYHFGELTSFVPGRLLDRVDFYPGNFSVRHGRVSGGVVEARVRDPRNDGVHGVLDLSLLDSSLLVEGPLGDSTSVAIAARRSNIDLVFEQLVPEDAYSVLAAPVYADYQALVSHRMGDQELRLMAYGSRDELKLFISDPLEEDPALRGQIEGLLEFHRLQLASEGPLGRGLRHETQLAYGLQHLIQKVGVLDAELHAHELHARSEWSASLASWAVLNAGVDVEVQWLHGRYFGPLPPQNEGQPDSETSMATQRNVDIDGSFELASPAAFVEAVLSPTRVVTIVPGVRLDYFGQLEQATLDPRLGVRYAAGSSTTLKSGVGLFTQRPEYFRALRDIGNPSLSPYRAMHTSVGVEQGIGEGFRVEAEGFYKRITNRVVALPGGRSPRFVNDGVGRVYGLELSGEATPDEDTMAYVAYTLSRSERRDRNDAWRLFDEDRTHVLSAVGTRRLGAGWEVGARFRLASGLPETPIDGAVLDLQSGQYVPRFGETNGARRPVEHRLDVRVEKSWRVGPGSIAAYLDVINVYNAKQRAGTRYSYDYRTSQPIEGMPIFPNVGVRGEL